MKNPSIAASTTIRVPVLGALALALAACSSTPAPQPVVPATDPSVAAALPPGSEPGSLVRVDRDRNEVVLVAGPFRIAPGEGAEDDTNRGPHGGDHDAHQGHHDMAPAPAAGHDHEDRSPLVPLEWPVDGWLRGFRVALFQADGTRLARHHLHHLIAVNFDRRQVVYPVAERVIGVGRETEDLVLPSRLGIPLDRGTRLGVYASWHNEEARALDDVYLEVRIPFREEGDGGAPREILPIYMDVNNVIGETNAFDLPPGRSEHSFEFTVPVGGRILAASGHLHDYGVAVRLEDGETGEVLVEVEGQKDEEGRLTGVEQKVLRRVFGLLDASVRLEAGRTYRVVGVYENPHDGTLPTAAMAHMVGVFEPDAISGWQTVDRESADYRLDLSGLPEPLDRRSTTSHP